MQTTTRRKLPFGIAQVGKSFRNEVTPGNFILRTREFEQMEMEYFVRPDAEHFQLVDYWVEQYMGWYAGLGLARENLLPLRSARRRSWRTTRAARSTSCTATSPSDPRRSGSGRS